MVDNLRQSLLTPNVPGIGLQFCQPAHGHCQDFLELCNPSLVLVCLRDTQQERDNHIPQVLHFRSDLIDLRSVSRLCLGDFLLNCSSS